MIDHHIHLEKGPYTLPWLETFWEVGRSRGLDGIGFSEHAYRFRQCQGLLPNSWADQRCTQDLDAYVDLVLKAKQAGLPVLFGIEFDYWPESVDRIGQVIAEYPFDYVIGSVHWLGDWGFDLALESQRWQDPRAVYEQYFALWAEAASTGLFQIMAHPDLIKIFGHRYPGDLIPLWDQALNSLPQGTVIEASSAGWRKPVGEIYPHPDLLRHACLRQVGVVASSDAHCPEDVGRDLDRVAQILGDVGYEEVWTFHERRPLSKPLKARG